MMPPPPPPPPQSLLLWVRASDLTGLPGDDVTFWPDVSGNDRHLTWNGAVAPPTIYGEWVPEGVEFASTVRLLLADPLFPGNDMSVYMIVAKSGAATTNGPWFGGWPPPNQVGNIGVGHRGTQAVVKGATVNLFVNAAMNTDEWHLLALRKTNTTMYVEFDGVLISSGAISSTLDPQFLGMGAYNPAPLMGSAVFGECIIYGGFLNDDLHEEITYYLMQKYGLA